MTAQAETPRRQLIERPAARPPGFRRLLADVDLIYVVNGFIGLIFAATGPVAVVLAVGRQGLTPRELASWIFGSSSSTGC
jgi:benzoate membrane transport protein